MQFIGQKENLEIIDKWEQVPPFLIIQGDEHTGKKFLTLYLCKKFGLHYVPIDISVKEVRSVIKMMKPNLKNLYHFDNFHKASLQAKNALLKITEEPVPDNYIVITGGPQIKTLESRAKKILMAPYEESEIRECLNPFFPDKEIQDALIGSGINTPAKIEYYKKYEHIETLSNFALEIADKITYVNPDIILSILPRFANQYEDIDACLLFLTMLINIIENKIKTKRYYSYDQVLVILLNARKELIRQPMLKRKMFLFKTFYKIYELGRDR